MAVAAGLCRHVLCFRTVWESTFAALAAQGKGGPARSGGGRVSGPMQEWRAPFGAHVGLQLDRHERATSTSTATAHRARCSG